MKKILLTVLITLFMFPLTVFGVNSSFQVGYDLNQSICTRDTKNGGYQDRNISTYNEAYFSYCMKAICNSNDKYVVSYHELYKNEGVTCLNGNSDPYSVLYKSGCDNYNRCNSEGDTKYCSVVIKYDCSRVSNGSLYTTTTTTKKTTKRTTRRTGTKVPTTSSTTTQVIINTKLKSLSLSYGSIIFSSDVYEYSLSIEENINSIDITAVPDDANSKVEILNNNNLVDGSVISIIVSDNNGNKSEYKINITKKVTLSNNANLKNLVVNGYEESLTFNNKITDYTLVIDEDDKTLDLSYEVEDEKSIVQISNNNNLTNGSKVTISVTAEDGTAKYYYINILIKEKSNGFGIIFIIIIILAILAGAYYLYQKFVGSKKGDKYEYE